MSPISPSSSLTRFTTSVRIARPVDAVFAFVADPRTFPDWNSAVESVVATSRPTPAVGARYDMSRLLPDGRASNELEIVTSDPRASSSSGRRAARRRLSVAARAVKRGVDTNFATLRAILEAGG